MIYSRDLTVPANTTRLSPATSTIKLTNGTIKQIMVGFPLGAAALVHIQAFYQNTQILPFSPGESIAWDDYIFPFVFDYPVWSQPNEIKLIGWSDDDFFSHVISFWIEHQPATVPLISRLLRIPTPQEIEGS